MSVAQASHQEILVADQELDENYPNRPRNHGRTLPFHDLFLRLFNPLNENKKRPTGPPIARRKRGRHGPSNLSPHEARKSIIERFISRWRAEVGNDIYPAFRLIIPEKDRDRAIYGLKEKAIGKILVKVMKINKDSEDGYSLLNWKLPRQSSSSRLAGDFAGRCYEVMTKRPIRTEVGDVTISQVNDLLDKLSRAQKEDQQVPIFEEFYSKMNADELQWLIRIILRQMKVGATEKTFFDIWHPDAENLYNVTSSLRRVCWDLPDPFVRLGGEDTGVSLMQCFQPQLAQFQIHSFQKMVDKMGQTEQDRAFWIEEKLDGERMQLHMVSDDSLPGGKRFSFWSRKAKDYTYLYGNGFLDENAALTRHIQHAFHEGVRNLILDGEMITWDLEQDGIVPFGTLKTAALAEQRNPFSNTGQRPLYRVFDILYLNGEALTRYTLRDRRKALEASIKSIHRRIEVHPYTAAFTAAEIEPHLRKVVAEASEGLVLKNPRSDYRLNERNDDWMKVKPEYMAEFGESLDCIVVGGYYGSGHRGGNLSSFLCGLKVDQNQIQQGSNPMKCYSFFKVGGGFMASDYATIRHQTDGKWKDWDPRYPPKDFVELAGGDLQYERPDVWIMPSDSIVLSVKAASVIVTDQFKTGFTLRFPRFKNLRQDRDWKSALSVQDFLDLKSNAEKEQKDKQFRFDIRKRKQVKTRQKKPTIVIGDKENMAGQHMELKTTLFEGLSFYILTESVKPPKRSKQQLEKIVKTNGGRIFQSHNAIPGIICIADKRLVPVVGIEKSKEKDIIRPAWLFDCIACNEKDIHRPKILLPLEPRHMFFTLDESTISIVGNVDAYGDSYARDTTVDELKYIFSQMPERFEQSDSAHDMKNELRLHARELEHLSGWMFEGCVIYVDIGEKSRSNKITKQIHQNMVEMPSLNIREAYNTVRFAGASLADDIDDQNITHVVVGQDRSQVKSLRERLSRRRRLARLVATEWIQRSWEEKTLLDEERFTAY